MKIDITENEKKIISSILLKFFGDEIEVIAFGSRVKGTSQKFSDFDIAIVSEKPISLSSFSEVKEAFEESNLPFIVDICDWQRISDEFREHIKQTGIIFALK